MATNDGDEGFPLEPDSVSIDGSSVMILGCVDSRQDFHTRRWK